MSSFLPKNKSLPPRAYRLEPKSGFMLLEIVVVLGIFTVVSSILLFNFTGFTSKATLDNTAQELALAIREAQLYGIAVRETETGSEVFPAYGINFNFGDPAFPGTNPITSFVLFADLSPGDQEYDGNVDCVNTECIKIFKLEPGYVVDSMCGIRFIGGGCDDLDELDITFRRPNPDATLIGDRDVLNLLSKVEITIRATRGDYTRVVTVWGNGQIATTEDDDD